uniref:C2H2-type domain-containing protein n=1 Tax=Steinernema glaseri TaxID=37863 RepID=A0A1I8AFT7_9BILA
MDRSRVEVAFQSISQKVLDFRKDVAEISRLEAENSQLKAKCQNLEEMNKELLNEVFTLRVRNKVLERQTTGTDDRDMPPRLGKRVSTRVELASTTADALISEIQDLRSLYELGPLDLEPQTSSYVHHPNSETPSTPQEAESEEHVDVGDARNLLQEQIGLLQPKEEPADDYPYANLSGNATEQAEYNVPEQAEHPSTSGYGMLNGFLEESYQEDDDDGLQTPAEPTGGSSTPNNSMFDQTLDSSANLTNFLKVSTLESRILESLTPDSSMYTCKECKQVVTPQMCKIREHIAQHEHHLVKCFFPDCQELATMKDIFWHYKKIHGKLIGTFTEKERSAHKRILEEAKVELQKSVSKYFPKFKVKDSSRTRAAETCKKCGASITKSFHGLAGHVMSHLNLKVACPVAGCKVKVNLLGIDGHIRKAHAKKIKKEETTKLNMEKQRVREIYEQSKKDYFDM